MDKLTYFLEVNLAFVLLYLVYRLAIGKGGYLIGRRIYLLSILPLALLFPLFSFPITLNPVGGLLNFNVMLQEVMVIGYSSQEVEAGLVRESIFLLFYFSMSLFWLLRLCFSLAIIWRRCSNLKHESYLRFRFVFDSKARSPYSFFYTIFLQPEQRHNTTVLTHEMAHARQLHSVDRLLAELAFILLWINPAVYLWRKSLEELHEYLADQEVVRLGTTVQDYSRSLVSAAYEQQGLRMMSCFSKQFTKRRLIMLQNIKKQKASYIGLTTILVAALFFVFACDNEESTFGSKKAEKAGQGVIVMDKIQGDIPNDQIADKVDEMPEYPGGELALLRKIASVVKYPKDAKDNDIEGRVFVRFVIGIDGNVHDVSVARSVNESLDKAAIEAVKQLSGWKPGKKNGELVAVQYTIPINFSLK